MPPVKSTLKTTCLPQALCTVATAGTDRVDNFNFTVQVVPEPATAALAGFGLFASVLFRRFRR
jgi:hypothetical protein